MNESKSPGSGAPGPRGRPSWSGLLRLSLVAVPVKAFAACSSTDAVHFHQLHANCGQRIQHRKHCPVHGAVETADIERGYRYAPDQYVVVEPEELNKLRPAKDRALVLEHFVPCHQVDPLQPFDADEYAYEVKWDGVRALAAVDRCQWRLWGRERADYDGRYPELVLQTMAGTLHDRQETCTGRLKRELESRRAVLMPLKTSAPRSNNLGPTLGLQKLGQDGLRILKSGGPHFGTRLPVNGEVSTILPETTGSY